MTFAKLATAKTFQVGPILDSTGAAKTDEVIASFKVTKNGTVGAVDAQDTLTHSHTGHYVYVSDGGDFDTLGEVEFSLNNGTNAMAPVKFQVLSATTYDLLITNAAGAAGGMLINGAANAGTTTLAALTVTGACTYGSTVLGNTTMGTLTQTGAASLGVGSTVTFATLAVTGALSVGTTTTLTGNVSLGGTLAVTGTTTLTGAVSHGSTTTYTGAFTLTDVTTGGTVGKIMADTLADTNELELDWKDGGRLDLLLDGASAAGDPWLTLIPGSYTAGMAGYILGTNINATISSRGTGTALDAAGIRTAVGLATANLDTQLAAIVEDTGTTLDTKINTISTAVVTTIPGTITTLTTNVGTIDTLLDKFAPLIIGTVSGAGTASEVFVYGGITATVVADASGNRTSVTFS